MPKTCSLMWNGLSTHPNGSVSVCCQANFSNPNSFARTNNQMLFLGKNTIEEIRNSDSFNRIRLEMLKGNYPDPCNRCYDTERSGGISKRMAENKTFNWSEENAIANEDGSIDTPLQFLELRLGNTCNLSCITCNSVSSSKWAKDEKALEQKIQWFKAFEENKQTRWFESEIFYRKLAEISNHVSKIYINGGEPLLIKQHKALLNSLIEMGVANKIKLEYSINLTIKDEEIVELWKNFKYVVVQFSIDALGEFNDYLRWGSKFEDIVSNLEWFLKNKTDNMYYMVCQTLSAINYREVPFVYSFLKKYNLDMHVNPVYSPSYYSAAALTEQEQEQVKESITKIDNQQIVSTVNSWLENNKPDYTERKKMKEVLSGLDETRGTNYKLYQSS
jgi:uncharacterized Fe-S cluster-containing radical SAM superfamily protein